MKTFAPVFLIFALNVCLVGMASAQSSYDLKSPDNRIQVRIRTAGQIRYDVVLKGKAILENSTISLDVEHKKLGIQPKVMRSRP